MLKITNHPESENQATMSYITSHQSECLLSKRTQITNVAEDVNYCRNVLSCALQKNQNGIPRLTLYSPNFSHGINPFTHQQWLHLQRNQTRESRSGHETFSLLPGLLRHRKCTYAQERNIPHTCTYFCVSHFVCMCVCVILSSHSNLISTLFYLIPFPERENTGFHHPQCLFICIK